ncbi:MAG: 3'(2'),5'-bisphosphate nucleotidase [bacterium]|nr:3'(2'),5'-bisphosphate nucleotidase [bacterium]
MYEKEIQVGLAAVRDAMRISKAIQLELAGQQSISKSDKSPVTIADFSAQAVVCKALNSHFPHIPIVAEESSDALKESGNKKILDRMLHYIAEDEAIGSVLNRDNLFESIDYGNAEAEGEIFWTLDPVDGTKGFLRGEQYAIALALIVKGVVRLGILGCPNLEVPGYAAPGFLLSAVAGEGARLWNAAESTSREARISSLTNVEGMRFVESYESAHSNSELQLEIARILKMKNDPVRLDSQVKYGILATGNGEIYLRIPNAKSPDYKEKIWDHAAGSIIISEAGGKVSDMFGKPLDFSVGKTLANNTGIFASVPAVHPKVLEIIEGMKK